MGIDFKVESKTNDEWNRIQHEKMNHWCKYAWRDIEWKKIFQIIHFEISCLYNCIPNYWDTSHLNDVLINLNKLKNKDPYFIKDYSYELTKEKEKIVEKLMPDIEQLIKFFEEYVEMNCRIIIY